jgi:hypothetical protein
MELIYQGFEASINNHLSIQKLLAKNLSMGDNKWIPLIEYSNKHRVSMSTLRRRIKNHSIQFKLEEGKYFVIDDTIEKTTKGRKPIQFDAPAIPAPVLVPTTSSPVVLEELKRAYSTALHSKEEIIFQLKEEVADLKTLVRVLEEEVIRLKRNF